MECSSEHFPAGLRVLVVDDDPICLLIVERLLRSCSYQVTTCGAALIALTMLREDRSRFDVVLSDVHMPEMDGFKLLELVRLEMDVPVIMMSTNKETSSVMKGIAHGACDYLLKPVRLEELRNIWQHVVRKQQCAVSKGSDRASVPRDHIHRHRKVEMDTKTTSDDRSSSCVTQKKRKASLDEEIANDDDDSFATAKRQRVVWSVELHQKFVSAINHLGLEQAVPKRILDLMNVPNLTRENVASHLQKYRLYLKKMSGSLSQKLSIAGSSVGASGSFINSFAFLNGYSTAQALELFSQQSSALPFLPGMPGIHREEAMNSSDHLGAKQAGIDPSLEHKDLQLVDANLQGHLVTSPGIKDGRLQLLIGQHMGTGGPISYPKAGFGYPCDQLSPGLYGNSDLLSQQGVKGSPLTEGPNANKYGAYITDHLPIQALDTSAGLGSVPYTTLHSVFDLIEK